MNQIDHLAAQTGHGKRGVRAVDRGNNFLGDQALVFRRCDQLGQVDQVKDPAARCGEALEGVRAETDKVELITAAAFACKRLDETIDQLIVARQGQLQQVVKTQPGVSQ